MIGRTHDFEMLQNKMEKQELLEALGSAGMPSNTRVRIAVDETGHFYIAGYGGMGSAHWQKLSSGNPNITLIAELFNDGYLRQEGPILNVSDIQHSPFAVECEDWGKVKTLN